MVFRVLDFHNWNIDYVNVINTGLVLSFLFTIRFFLMRAIRGKADIIDINQRRWMNRVNNAVTAFLMLSLIFIWAPQLESFAISVTAFSVALVLIFKELLMCFTGSFMRGSGQAFEIGDWIDVDGLTGEILRISALSILIEEVDVKGKTYQYTGRTTSIPNSKFLSSNVMNLNFLKHYIYYDIDLHIKTEDYPITDALENLKHIIEIHFAPHRTLATRYNRIVERKTAVDFCDADPQYFLYSEADGFVMFRVRLFVPTNQAIHIASLVTRDFLDMVYKKNFLDFSYGKDLDSTKAE